VGGQGLLNQKKNLNWIVPAGQVIFAAMFAKSSFN